MQDKCAQTVGAGLGHSSHQRLPFHRVLPRFPSVAGTFYFILLNGFIIPRIPRFVK